jgi:hypothetical protein
MDRGDWIQIGVNIGALALLMVAEKVWERRKIRRTARKKVQHSDFNGTGLFI